MLQLSPAPAPSYFERLRAGAGRRTLAIGLAVLIECLLLLVFLSLNPGKPAGTADDALTVVTLEPEQVAQESTEPAEPETRPATAERPAPQPQPLPPQPAEPTPATPPPVASPLPRPPAPPTPRTPARPAPPVGPLYGPPDTGRPSFLRDTERVGTAPNGEPLYAAAWYREPRDETLRHYLSTARGPGWGLIACRTAPDYRVEDCVALGEYPEGSQIARAVLAAAWEFKVRPPRLGGQSLVGAWVRIRIDYQRN